MAKRSQEAKCFGKNYFFMALNNSKTLMSLIFSSQFNHCSLIWIFHNYIRHLCKNLIGYMNVVHNLFIMLRQEGQKRLVPFIFASKNWVGRAVTLCFLEIPLLIEFYLQLVAFGASVVLFPSKLELFSLLYRDNFAELRRFSHSNFFVRSNYFKLKCKSMRSFICNLHREFPSRLGPRY